MSFAGKRSCRNPADLQNLITLLRQLLRKTARALIGDSYEGGVEMPVEIIGEAGSPGASREWIDAECQLAFKHLKQVCHDPPPEMELEVQWQEHDLGEYRRSF
jgi:hypothetical protein